MMVIESDVTDMASQTKSRRVRDRLPTGNYDFQFPHYYFPDRTDQQNDIHNRDLRRIVFYRLPMIPLV
jgi:hypothetical protein